MFGRKQRLGVGAVRKNLEPTPDAPGVCNAADLYGVRRKFGGFELGQHCAFPNR